MAAHHATPDELAAQLRKAMKGLGTDDKQLREILAHTSNETLQHVRTSFKNQFARDLIDDIASETSGNYRDTAKALVLSHAEQDAMTIHKAIAGLGTDEALLMEVLCTRSGPEMHAAAAAFRALYSKDLSSEVKDDVSGDFKKLLAALCTEPRTTNPPAAQLDTDVQLLFKAGEGRLGTDEAQFIRIFSHNPKPYVEAVAAKYAAKYNHTMDQVIKGEFSGHLKKALQILATPYVEYFADKLYHSMKGVGTNDSELIRIIVSLKGRGLKEVTAFFASKYKDTLVKFIESDTSGDYKKLLVAVVEYWGK